MYCGKNSLIIMATHPNLICIFQRYIGKNLYGYISGILLLFIIMVLEVIIIKLVNMKNRLIANLKLR